MAQVSGRAGEGVVGMEAAITTRDTMAQAATSMFPTQTRLLIGYQIQPIEDLSLGFQYYAELMHDYAAYPPLSRPVSVETRRNHTLRPCDPITVHQTLRLSLYALYNTSNGDHFINPNRATTDRVGAQSVPTFGGKPWGLRQLARDDNLYLQVRYEF